MQKYLSLITVPYDSSHFNKRMGAGPLYLINHGLVQNLQNKGYEVDYTCIRLEEEFPAEIATTIKLLHEIKIAVTSAINNNSFPIVLSGNCYATVGVVNGLNEDKAAVLWFDAHGDCETPETTVTGFLDGMGLSMLMHCCWENLLQFNDLRRRVNGNKVVLVGARDLSISEEEFIKSNHSFQRTGLLLICVNLLNLRTYHRLIGSILALKEKLGPILFQLPPKWKVNRTRFKEFLEVLTTGYSHAF